MKKEIEFGLVISVHDIYRLHNLIRHRFTYLYVDVRGLEPEVIRDFLRKFSSAYKLIVYDSSLKEFVNWKSEEFAHAMAEVRWMLKTFKNHIYAYALLLSDMPDKKVKVFKDIFLTRFQKLVYREDVKMILVNDEKNNTGVLTSLYRLKRTELGKNFVEVGVDFENAYYSGVWLVDSLGALDTLAKDTYMLILSGVQKGKQVKGRKSILYCDEYKWLQYIDLIYTFRRSVVVLHEEVLKANDLVDKIKREMNRR